MRAFFPGDLPQTVQPKRTDAKMSRAIKGNPAVDQQIMSTVKSSCRLFTKRVKNLSMGQLRRTLDDLGLAVHKGESEWKIRQEQSSHHNRDDRKQKKDTTAT
jgi:hypothetical protein